MHSATVDRDFNANESPKANRGSYIPFHNNYEDARQVYQPVELQVTNLDQTMEQRDMKRIITGVFKEHVNVLHVSVFFQSDGNMAACVRVSSMPEAQYAISQLHRKKIGFKRILISRNDGQAHNPALLRSKVYNLFSDVPGCRLQLFKFREMYEKRYHDSIGVSDLYKMKDVVTIIDEPSGRMVQLSGVNGSRAPTPAPSGPTMAPANDLFLDSTTCPIHGIAKSHGGQIKGWAEKENGAPLPNVIIGLSVLGPNLKILVKDHGGSIPLAALTSCYEAEFKPFDINNEEGVPLEHLVTAIRGISVQTSPTSGVKVLALVSGLDEVSPPANIMDDTVSMSGRSGALSRFSGSSTSLNSLNSTPQAAPPLAGQLALFSRELVDLLKTSPGCRMPFHKFIPMYHHFFGRQCRVADYGYTKLKDLFEALPHVIQILGEGSRAMITLSHRSQIKRFTSDLLKILKSQPSKQMALYEMPASFEKLFHKTFKISDYGVCDLEDMITDVSETSVIVTQDTTEGNEDYIISIPKREQTNEEVARTQKFADECTELLRHVPECLLPFNKFIPAYHHHFGRQCRVGDYGFTKLIELFEAIPTTIEITEDADGERILQLTDVERLNVVGDHIAFLVKNNSIVKRKGQTMPQCVRLEDLPELYLRQYGYALRPENFSTSLKGLIEKLSHSLRLESLETEDSGEITHVRLIDRSYIKILSNRVKELLVDHKDAQMPLDSFLEQFREIYSDELDLQQLKSDLKDLVVIQDNSIELVPLQLCGVRIQTLLKEHGEKMLMSEFEAAFAEKFMVPLCPGQFGFPGLANLLTAFPELFVVRGRGPKKMVCIVRDRDLRRVNTQPNRGPSMMNTFGNSRPSNYAQPNKSYTHLRQESSSNMMRQDSHHRHSGGQGTWSNRVLHPPPAAPQRNHRTTPSQMRFSQPPPPSFANFNTQPGFGGSSGPGCGGGDFWAELAHFGIYPSTSASTLGTSSQAVARNTFASGRVSPSPVFGTSPISSPGFATSMLPTPHSPSPLLQNRSVTGTHFAFPPTSLWPPHGHSYNRRSEH